MGLILFDLGEDEKQSKAMAFLFVLGQDWWGETKDIWNPSGAKVSHAG